MATLERVIKIALLAHTGVRNKVRLGRWEDAKRAFVRYARKVYSAAFTPNGGFALTVKSTLKLCEIDWEYEYDPKHDPVLKRRAEQA